MKEDARPERFEEIDGLSLHGGHIALDFVNTVDWRDRADAHEVLTDYPVLLRWARRVGIISDDREFEALLEESERHPRKARDALRRAIDLREALYRIAAAIAAEATPSSADLATVNAAFSDAVAHATVTPADEGFTWSWSGADPWSRVVWPLAAAGHDLLFSSDLERIKKCGHGGCGWVFLDLSKNVSRRWCSMQGCGSREKMRRQYRRKKSARRPRSRRRTTKSA